MKKTKIIPLFLVLLFMISCNDSEQPTPVKEKKLQTETGSKHDAIGARAPCGDCNQPTTCWEEVTIGGETWTYAVPCGSGGDGGSPPPGSPPTFPAAPSIYCAPSSLPNNPANGAVYKISTAGSNCLSPVYYYTCASGGVWLAPVSFVYGAAPTTNLYSGLRYQTDYNGTSITYVYMSALAGSTNSWFYLVKEVHSTGCVLPDA